MATVKQRPAKLDWWITAGDDVSLEITRKDSAGTVIDLTNYTYAASVSYGNGSTQAITCTLTDASNGVLTLSIAAADTADLTDGKWYLDETVGGASSTILAGEFNAAAQGDGGV